MKRADRNLRKIPAVLSSVERIFTRKIIHLQNRQSKTIPSSHKISKFIQLILKAEQIKTAQLTVLFTNTREIRRLNKKFLNRDVPTDVLSFDMRPKWTEKKIVIGDIVICVDLAYRNAKAYRCSARLELYRYIIHGILHLTGYDDVTPLESQKMWKRQEALLEKIENRR